jgi:hypothetical protein
MMVCSDLPSLVALASSAFFTEGERERERDSARERERAREGNCGTKMEIKMREILFVRDRWGELWVRYFF